MGGRNRFYQQLLVGLCVLAVLAGCGSLKAEETKKSLRIGVSLYRGDDTFINNIRGEMENCAKEYEQKHGIKVTLDIQDAKGSHSQLSGK